MTEQRVSPVIAARRAKQEADAAAAAAKLQGAAGEQQQQETAATGDVNAAGNQQEQTGSQDTGAEQQQEQAGGEQQSEQGATEQSQEQEDGVKVHNLSFETPLAEQRKDVDVIDLSKVTPGQPAETGSVVAAAAKAVEEKKNFHLIRAKEVFDRFELITGPKRAYDQAEFVTAHRTMLSFLTNSLSKAGGREFIELVDFIVGRIREDKAGEIYGATRYFRGIPAQTQTYVRLMNILFDMAKKINRQSLMNMDLGKAIGNADIGAKLADYVNRV